MNQSNLPSLQPTLKALSVHPFLFFSPAYYLRTMHKNKLIPLRCVFVACCQSGHWPTVKQIRLTCFILQTISKTLLKISTLPLCKSWGKERPVSSSYSRNAERFLLWKAFNCSRKDVLRYLISAAKVKGISCKLKSTLVNINSVAILLWSKTQTIEIQRQTKCSKKLKANLNNTLLVLAHKKLW